MSDWITFDNLFVLAVLPFWFLMIIGFCSRF